MVIYAASGSWSSQGDAGPAAAAESDLIDETGEAAVRAADSIANRQGKLARRDAVASGGLAAAQKLTVAKKADAALAIVDGGHMMPRARLKRGGIRVKRRRILAKTKDELQLLTNPGLLRHEQKLVIALAGIFLVDEKHVARVFELGLGFEPKFERERARRRQRRVGGHDRGMAFVFALRRARKTLQAAAEAACRIGFRSFQLGRMAVAGAIGFRLVGGELPKAEHLRSGRVCAGVFRLPRFRLQGLRFRAKRRPHAKGQADEEATDEVATDEERT